MRAGAGAEAEIGAGGGRGWCGAARMEWDARGRSAARDGVARMGGCAGCGGRVVGGALRAVEGSARVGLGSWGSCARGGEGFERVLPYYPVDKSEKAQSHVE